MEIVQRYQLSPALGPLEKPLNLYPLKSDSQGFTSAVFRPPGRKLVAGTPFRTKFNEGRWRRYRRKLDMAEFVSF